MEGIIIPDIFENTGVKAFFTEKTVGIDTEKLTGFLGNGCGVYLPVQKHTDNVIVVGEYTDREVADAVVTTRDDVFIGVQTADCVPLLLCDCQKGVIAAVHAGWRGTGRAIVKNVIRTFCHTYSSVACDILVSVGPSIRSCCYEVGQEVIDAVTEATGEGDYYFTRNGKRFIDLAQANVAQALSCGITRSHIWVSDECTYCRPERFFSYRRMQTFHGRQGAFIGKMA